MKLCKQSFPWIDIKWIDINDNISDSERESIISNTDLLISTSSDVIDIPNDIKNGLCVIDCWLIKWKLWNRWSIPINKDNIKKYSFLTPVPWWVGPLEMLYMVGKVKWLNNQEIDLLLEENLIYTNL